MSPGGKGARGQPAQALKFTPEVVNVFLVMTILWGIILTSCDLLLCPSIYLDVHNIVCSCLRPVKHRPGGNHWIIEMCEGGLDKTTVAQLDGDLMKGLGVLASLWLTLRRQFLNIKFFALSFTFRHNIHVTVIIRKVNNGLPIAGCTL